MLDLDYVFDPDRTESTVSPSSPAAAPPATARKSEPATRGVVGPKTPYGPNAGSRSTAHETSDGWSAQDLPPPWRELYEERAAIMELDANMTRADAERFALADILNLISRANKKRT